MDKKPTKPRRGTTIYLNPHKHHILKRMAEQEGKSLHALLQEGVALVLRSYGCEAVGAGSDGQQ